MDNTKNHITIATLANATELVNAVTVEVIGNEVADTINNMPLSRSAIGHLAQASFNKSLNIYRKD